MNSKEALYDHIAESYNFLKAKYKQIHFLLIADSNRLNLQPILNLSHDLNQVVKIATRLNPPATLDTIITSMAHLYQEPITKPPIQSDMINGKPSDHLVVLFQPKQNQKSQDDLHMRKYNVINFRPLPESGLAQYGNWLKVQNWSEIYRNEDIDFKANFFQNTLLHKFYEIFPMKSMKVSEDDQPCHLPATR